MFGSEECFGRKRKCVKILFSLFAVTFGYSVFDLDSTNKLKKRTKLGTTRCYALSDKAFHLIKINTPFSFLLVCGGVGDSLINSFLLCFFSRRFFDFSIRICCVVFHEQWRLVGPIPKGLSLSYFVNHFSEGHVIGRLCCTS